MENNTHTPSNSSTHPTLADRASAPVTPALDHCAASQHSQMRRKAVSLVPMPRALVTKDSDDALLDLLSAATAPTIPAPVNRRVKPRTRPIAANEAKSPRSSFAEDALVPLETLSPPEDDVFLSSAFDDTSDLHELEDYCKMAQAEAYTG